MEERSPGEHCTPYYLAEPRANIQAEDHIKTLVLLPYFPTLNPRDVCRQHNIAEQTLYR
jgi:hypothetical protein